jgi:hypothetical protein
VDKDGCAKCPERRPLRALFKSFGLICTVALKNKKNPNQDNREGGLMI